MFDVGGVLLDWFASSKAFADKYSLPHTELLNRFHEPYKKSSLDTLLHTGKIDPQKAWDIVLKPYNISIPIEEIIADWCKDEFWIKDSLNLLTELVDAGYQVALFSNSWFSFNRASRAPLFPSQLMSGIPIFDSGELGHMKPDPKIYEIIEKRLDESSPHLYFIDDNTANIEAANARGWQGRYFESRQGEEGVRRSIAEIKDDLLNTYAN